MYECEVLNNQLKSANWCLFASLFCSAKCESRNRVQKAACFSNTQLILTAVED